MMTPTLRQLSFLIALADHGSFIAAAEACHVTQPSLSAAIKELEAIFNTQLVERHRSGLKLTDAGAAAVARARMILADVDALSEAVRGAAEPLTGRFRLGVIPTIAPFLLPQALPKIAQSFPKLQLYLREDLTHRLMEGLKNHSLDAAVIALPWEMAGIDYVSLFDDEFLFIGPKGHHLEHEPSLTPKKIEEERVLLLEDGHCLRDHAMGVCNLVRPGAEDVRATSLFTLVQMAAGGLGVSLLPKIAQSHGLDNPNLFVRPFDPPLIGRQVGIAWRAGSIRAREAKLLGDLFIPAQTAR